MDRKDDTQAQPPARKRPYTRPRLTEYGSVAKLTRTGSGTIIEGTSPNKMMR